MTNNKDTKAKSKATTMSEKQKDKAVSDETTKKSETRATKATKPKTTKAASASAKAKAQDAKAVEDKTTKASGTKSTTRKTTASKTSENSAVKSNAKTSTTRKTVAKSKTEKSLEVKEESTKDATDKSVKVDEIEAPKGEVCVLPLITLRAIIITPSANVQLIAARENTVMALQEALNSTECRDIAVFTQIADREMVPYRDDLARIGIMARVIAGSFNDKQQFRATIRGFQRIKIRRIISDPTDQVRHVEVEVIPIPKVDPQVERRYIQALRSTLDTALEQQDNGGHEIIDKNIPSEMVSAIRDTNNLAELTDGLSQILTLMYFDKKYVLEAINPVDRAKALIAFLNNFSYKEEVDKKIADDARVAMERNQRDFYLNEQLKAIKRELNILVDDSNEIEDYRTRLANLDAPIEVINRLQKEISRINGLPASSGENGMVRNYVDTLLSIPWRKSSELNKDLGKAKDILEEEHYGLRKVKDRILEFLAVQTRRDNTDAHGQILCLMGPPGIGKTSLANSIARATGRKYVRVALGGMYDESEIRGHRRTYVGAMPGRIIQSMIKCNVNNPLFLLDEIDKVSTNTYHGDISAALLEVLDPEQNKSFSDNYVDLDYDLSQVLFIATANSYNIPPALRDRMEIIDLSSYTADEKFHIAREHLMPKQLKNNGLTPEEFDISDAGIKQLIAHYTLEAGVRSLERIIAELCRKVVKELMINPPKKPTKTVLGIKEIEKLIGPKRVDFTSKLKENKVGVVNGLSVSSVGGDMLQVEVIANEGKGSHLLTGQLGSVMKESVSAGISWVRSKAREFSLAPDFYQSVDLHIHFPEGAVKKDGPSAGCATVTAIISALTGNPVRADVAMTGEITLRGDVLTIGGLKEKLLAALRGGVKTVCIPFDNKKDLWDIPENVTKGLKIVPVKTINEVLDIALEKKPKDFTPNTCEMWTLKGYDERQKKRKLKDEAEERKYSIDIKADTEIKDLNNGSDDADNERTPETPSRGRRGRTPDNKGNDKETIREPVLDTIE